jgi:hypothetical protein
MTPAAVHFGTAEALWLKRQAVLQAAYHAHPERFSRGLPIPPRWPDQVGINAPKTLPLSGECISNDIKLSPPVSKNPDSVGEILRWRVQQKPIVWLKRDVAPSSNRRSAPD